MTAAAPIPDPSIAATALPDFALAGVVGGDADTRAAVARALDAEALVDPDAPLADALSRLGERLAARRATVALTLDRPDRAARDRLRAAAEAAHAPPVLVVIRADAGAVGRFAAEGFHVVALEAADPIAALARVVRTPLACDRRADAGPFDLIGDVHGCADELEALLAVLGYGPPERPAHPEGRRLLFLGDLCDRGPANAAVLARVIDLVEAGVAEMVLGNHDEKLGRWLVGRKVTIAHGLGRTVDELERAPAAFRDRVRAFLDARPSHLWLDGGRLVVAHAGLPAAMHGRASKAERRHALYGETTGSLDAYGLPERLDFARHYEGAAAVVHGHTPLTAPAARGRVLCIDTACVFGGALTALRWPERRIVSVPARAVHWPATRPIEAPTRAQSVEADWPDV